MELTQKSFRLIRLVNCIKNSFNDFYPDVNSCEILKINYFEIEFEFTEIIQVND